MVCGVVTIVEEQKVKPSAGEVPRVVVLGPGICVHMLDKVEEHDHRAGADRGQNQRKEPEVKPQPSLLSVVDHPRQDPHAHVRADPENVLQSNTRMEARLSMLRPADIVFDGKTLEVAGYRRIGQSNPQIVLVRESPSRRGVPRTIDEVVVVQIVSWNPHQRWITVDHERRKP